MVHWQITSMPLPKTAKGPDNPSMFDTFGKRIDWLPEQVSRADALRSRESQLQRGDIFEIDAGIVIEVAVDAGRGELNTGSGETCGEGE